MACDALHTGGSQFLSTALAHLDCQGRTIGAYGYGALADPNSSVLIALTGVLTIFVALFGIRLLTGHRLDERDLVADAIRVGLFLALASSWPAWRIVGYDLVMDGPGQVAQSIGAASGLPGNSNDLVARLQDADNALVSLTMYGSGRLTGGISVNSDFGDTARGIALADQSALGWGRTAFLATTIGAFGLLRIGAGILLALAPLMAGLLLFTGTFSIFSGWLRGLLFCALGSLAFSIIASAELALLYPWLSDVLAQRQANILTPSAPTELLVLTLAFAIMMAGSLFLIGRITFLSSMVSRAMGEMRDRAPVHSQLVGLGARPQAVAAEMPGRAEVITGAVAATIRREESSTSSRIWEGGPRAGEPSGTATASRMPTSGSERLGDSWRRSARRTSAAGQRRDRA